MLVTAWWTHEHRHGNNQSRHSYMLTSAHVSIAPVTSSDKSTPIVYLVRCRTQWRHRRGWMSIWRIDLSRDAPFPLIYLASREINPGRRAIVLSPGDRRRRRASCVRRWPTVSIARRQTGVRRRCVSRWRHTFPAEMYHCRLRFQCQVEWRRVDDGWARETGRGLPIPYRIVVSVFRVVEIDCNALHNLTAIIKENMSVLISHKQLNMWYKINYN